MRVLVQRSKESSVEVNGKIVGEINHGMVIFVSFTYGDSILNIEKMINKILNLRIYEDENDVMNLSIDKEKDQILSISQFTLYASTKKGNRPSYAQALNGEEAKKLYDLFNQKLSEKIKVETGLFGAEMKVVITNDGPVTIWLEN